MAEDEYTRGYERAKAAVDSAVKRGLIACPEDEDLDHWRVNVAEHFMVGLGVNEP